MGELSVRRDRELAVRRFQGTSKTEKQAAAGQAKPAAVGGKAATVSETLERLMGRVTQAGRQAREGRRTLQSGEIGRASCRERV